MKVYILSYVYFLFLIIYIIIYHMYVYVRIYARMHVRTHICDDRKTNRKSEIGNARYLCVCSISYIMDEYDSRILNVIREMEVNGEEIYISRLINDARLDMAPPTAYRHIVTLLSSGIIKSDRIVSSRRVYIGSVLKREVKG